MKTPHKHAELIKEWADGATIQFRFVGEDWATLKSPFWDAKDGEYRIKPKPDVVQKVKMWAEGKVQTSVLLRYSSVSYVVEGSNLKLTFDGETGELKSAEVL